MRRRKEGTTPHPVWTPCGPSHPGPSDGTLLYVRNRQQQHKQSVTDGQLTDAAAGFTASHNSGRGGGEGGSWVSRRCGAFLPEVVVVVASRGEIRWPKRDRHVFLEGSIPFSHQISTTLQQGRTACSALSAAPPIPPSPPFLRKNKILALAKKVHGTRYTVCLCGFRARKVLCRASADRAIKMPF